MENNIKAESLVASFFKKNKLIFAIALFTSCVLNLTNLIISKLIQEVTDAISNSDSDAIFRCLIITISVIVGMVIFSIIMSRTKSKFIARALAQYKDAVCMKIAEKGIAAFKHENSSLYISALTNDISSITSGYLTNLFTIIKNILLFFGALMMMLLYSPLMTLFAVLFALLPVFASVFAGSKLVPAEKAVSDSNESFVGILKEGLDGFSVVKSFKAEGRVFQIIKDYNCRLEEARNWKLRLQFLIGSFGAIAGFITQIGVFIVGAYMAIKNPSITVGTVLAFTNLMNFIIGPIAELPELIAEKQAALGLVEKISNALENEAEETDSVNVASHQNTIEIKNLNFAYEKNILVLKDINVIFEKGKSYALVGMSGSGKSTLLNMLLSSFDDYQGSILFDDIELKEINKDSLYDIVSVIEQNVFIFNASIKDNITMFTDIPAELVDNAIKQAGLSEFIKEKGEQYLCGDNGANLSGGERQRISIARSLVRRAQVMLIDEATSSLDGQTAKTVMESVLSMPDITRIIVSHNFDDETLKRFDYVLAIKNGRIIETGSYEELMSQKGYLYSLINVMG